VELSDCRHKYVYYDYINAAIEQFCIIFILLIMIYLHVSHTCCTTIAIHSFEIPRLVLLFSTTTPAAKYTACSVLFGGVDETLLRVMTMMMRIISLFGQLRVQASSQGCEPSKCC
jgi:hypothetical protein